jgi:UDP-N-acetylglucosamine--N-acetylmuramyl-(pentapeptide) pyrophosphoryl-undecaprenol N-acetylglucosamine transferase
LTGGGSGGHITPLLSLARELKAQSPNCEVIYIGSKGDNLDTLKQVSHDFDFMSFIKAGKFRRYHGQGILSGILHPHTLILNVRDFFRFPGSVLASRRILRKFRPDVVFSKGGFVAVPVGLASRMYKIPIVTHDSDSVPGLANRIVGRWAKIHATGMPARYYDYPKSTIEYVGIPIDERIKKVTQSLQNNVKQSLNLPTGSQVLLVSGGGNGSKHLNDLMLQIAPELLSINLSLYIIHLSGQANEEEVKAGYKKLSKAQQKRVFVFGHTNSFHAYSAAADLIITRAGATTLAELAVAGKACIVIPAPFLTGGHQLKNADVLAKKDAAVVIPDDTQPDEFLALVNGLLSNPNRRYELARNINAISNPDASTKLAKLILAVAK